LGTIAIPVNQLRFVELEGAQNRVSTFGTDLFVGKIQTTEFHVKMINTSKELKLNRDRIKRMTFPDPPQTFDLFEEVPAPVTKKDDTKKDKDKDSDKDKKDKDKN